MLLVASGDRETRARWSRAAHDGYGVLEAADLAELARGLARVRAGAIVLDVDLLGRGGLAGLGEIARAQPGAPILLIAGSADEAEGLAALRAGARGYSRRALPPASIADALGTVWRGGVWVERGGSPRRPAAGSEPRLSLVRGDPRRERGDEPVGLRR